MVDNKEITILITGISGLIGSNLSRYLLDKGYNVLGVDNLSGGYKDFIDDRIISKNNFFEFDLNDVNKLHNLFTEHKIDYVYHLAAYAAEGLSPFIRNYNYTNNILSSVNIINECINFDVKKLIFTSSMAVYGFGNPPFMESQLPSPIDPYGIAKYAVEMDINQASNQFNLKYNIIRPHNIVGIYQNIWDRYRNVIGIWIRKSLKNENITIYGDGEQVRAFSDIKYYLEIFEKLLYESDNEIFNIGADNYFKIKDVAIIVRKIANKYGYKTELEFLQPRHEVKEAYCNHDKAKYLLNFMDDTKLEELIEEMFVWAIKQPDRFIKDMIYEVDKNIYEYWK
jgi:UDP-glucose 4-epimerase